MTIKNLPAAGLAGGQSGLKPDGARPRPLWIRLAPLGVFLALLGLAWATGLFRYLSFEALREQRGRLISLAEAYPVAMLAAYFVAYAVGTVAMMPGVLFWGTIAGGLMFGLAWGAPASLLAGTTGAILLFLIARTSLGDVMHRWAGKWLVKLEAGFAENALSYMFAMRFLLIPYPVVNLVPGLLGARLRDFAITTFLGLIPSMTAYTLVGAGLGASLDAGNEPDIVKLTLNLAPAFVALGLVALAPVVWKRLARRKKSGDSQQNVPSRATEKRAGPS